MQLTSGEVVFSLDADLNGDCEAKADLFVYENGLVKVPGPWKRGRPKGKANQGISKKATSENSSPIRFEFINAPSTGHSLDKLSQDKVRSHARLSRNRPSRPVEHRAVRRKRNQAVQIFSRLAAIINLRQIYAVDPFECLPVKLDSEAYDLLKYYDAGVWRYLYAIESSVDFNPVREYWLPMAFEDPDMLYIFVGCAEIHAFGYYSETEVGRELRHLQAAIMVTKRRLKDVDSVVSPATIAIIAGMSMMEKSAGRHHNWQIHMQGLKRLIDLSGGLDTFSSSPLLLGKIYRADMYGSLDASQTPFFDGPGLFLAGKTFSRPFKSPRLNRFRDNIGLDEMLCTCVHRLEEATEFWTHRDTTPGASEDSSPNTKKKMGPADAANMRQLLTSVQYSLAKAASSTEGADSFQFCRLALAFYSMTLLNERPGTTDVGRQLSETFRRQFMVLLEKTSAASFRLSEESWIGSLAVDFCLWAFALANFVIRFAGFSIRDWMIQSFSRLASPEYGNVRDLSDLRNRLRQYIWAPSLHDSNLAWLWDRVKETRLDSEISLTTW